jgi:hypothetical protein
MRSKPACRVALAPLFAVTTLALGLAVDTRAQTIHSTQPFTIDLRVVGKYYDTLYRNSVTGELTDSVAVYDWEHTRLGTLGYRVKNLLPTDASPTREVVDYSVVPGYRARFTVPRSEYFEASEQEVGVVLVRQPRDMSIPGLSVELTPMEDVVDEIARRSRQQVWAETARASLAAGVVTTTTSGGIVFNIPLPMPKSLESIFGPGEKTSITIKGREEITLAGETSIVDPFIGIEGREKQSLFPSLDMQQKLDVSLTGTIGDKVSIQVDHSSEAIGDDANRVRLAYTGYEDEVIQLIELGNTSLSLPGSQLVSFSTSAQGLFGVKMLAKMGSTDITLIASKQEGEVSSSVFSPTGGTLGQAEARVIRDIDYVKNKYFYFDNPNTFIGPDDGKLIEVYRTVTQQDLIVNPGINRLPGWAIADSLGYGQSIEAAVDSIRAGATPRGALQQDFQLLQKDVDYFYILNSITNQVVGLELADAIPDAALKSLAVRYTTRELETPVFLPSKPIGGSYSTYGLPPDPLKGDMLILEMLKAPEPRPTPSLFPGTWNLMIRNIYNLGLTNIDGSTLEVTIEDVFNPRLNPALPDTSDVPYLRIFGLDRTDRTGTGKPDDRIDLTSGLVNLNTGVLQFPVLEPFTPPADSVARWTDGRFSFTGPTRAEQYNTSTRIYNERLNATTEQEVHQYVIKVTAVSTSKTFRINALNIVENSETITINNDKLIRGTDYDIDYVTGEVTLKEGALSKLTPDARISVEYEFKPLGGGGSSTLAGFATASQLGQNFRIGTSGLYESKSSSDNRPRLGEEPTRAIVGGITASYQHQSRLLTDLANLLPYVDTDAPSTFNLDGELAASLPNPNTKNEAYIDDFEGIEDTDRLSLARRAWYPASLPFDQGTYKAASDRLDFIWYNIEPNLGVHRRDLNPELDEQENTLVQSLDIDMSEMPAVGDTASFAGVILGVPGGGLDLSQGQFIELWVNDFKPDPITRGGKLHIDLGVIDENFHDPGNDDAATNFDDEDKLRDGFAAAFDDTGLDGLFDAEEPGFSDANPDPSGDDILLKRIDGRFSKANGTEANLNYDTEDLDRNGQLTRENAYFSYVIDLADTAQIDIRASYPGYDGFDDAGHENDSWRLYRVKLSNHTVVATSGLQPRLDEIRHVRIWFDDVNAVVRDDNAVGRRRLQISEFSIEGNRWELDGVRNLYDDELTATGTDFAIGVISTKTDPGYYHPPVVPNQKNEVSDKESSLALRYSGLSSGTSVQILKRFPGQGLNLTLYRDLNFWAHTDSLRDGLEYYFRMGSNESNYYEVTIPFTGTYYNETGWARVVLNLADLTNLKFEPQDSVVTGSAIDIADPSRVYPVRMRGLPNLTGVRFLFAGVRNVNGGSGRSGELWMDDIFTGDVMRDSDHAERLTANVSLAGGALSFGGNWARTGADYHGLRQTRGSGADQTTLGLNARTDLQYFLPLGGFSLPISGNYGEFNSRPKFPPNSDTEILEPEVADSLRTERKTRAFSTSLSKRSPSTGFLMRYTLDRIRPTFSYSDQRGISPSVRDTTTNMTGSVGYQLTWAGDKTFKLFGKNRMRWMLNQLDFSVSANRQTAKRWSFVNGAFVESPSQYSASMRQQGSARYAPFRSLDGNFNGFVLRDVGLEHEWAGINIGQEIARGENLHVSFAPRWIGVRLFEPTVETQTAYNEDSGPNVRKPGDPEGTRNVSSSRNDSGKMRVDVGKQFAALFKLFGWSPGAFTGRAPPTTPPEPSGQGGGSGEPPAAAPPDSTAQKPRPGIGHLATRLGQIMVSLRPVQFNLQHRENAVYLRIPDRPDVAYQLGLTTNTGLEVDGEPLDQPDQRTETWSYSLDSGVQLSKTFDVQGRYSRQISDSDFRANQSRSVNVSWPDIQANWDGLGSFRPLRPIVESGQLTMSYGETHQESGQRGLPPVNTNETLTFTPAVVLAWKNQLNTTVNFSYTSNTSETQGSASKSTSGSLNLDLKRNFRGGGGFNFFGKKMAWKNEMETSLIVSYARSGGERSTPGSPLVEPIPSTTSLRVAPTLRYFFSRTINGSAFIDYARNFAEQTDQTTTIVRVGVSAVITF